MSEPIVIELGWIPPKELRGNSRAHWRAKLTPKNELNLSGHDHGYIAKGNGIFPRARITFAFHHWRKIDLDNLTIGMKPWVDGLVDSEMFIDDDPDHVVYGEHQFVKVPKGESRTIVTIEELES